MVIRVAVAAVVVLAAGCAAFVGCAEKPVKAPTAVASTPTAVTTIAIPAPSSIPAASASAKAEAPADSSSANSGAEGPPNDARAPGEIACGKAICKVGKEECCPARGACEPVRDPSTPSGQAPCEAGNAYECDSRDDCAAGQSCCWLYGDPAAVTLCMSAPCPETEACHGASACAAGFRCKEERKEAEPGTCVFTSPKTTCGKVACSGAKPVCRWSSEKKSGTCVDGDETEAPEGEIDVRCSSSADCGGEHCCFWGGRTWCGACVNNSIVCKTRADCPSQMGGGQKLSGCVSAARPGWPPWLKVCEYD